MIAEKMGFEGCCTGLRPDLFPERWTAGVLSTLAGIAQSASKFANDIRLLAALEGD